MENGIIALVGTSIIFASLLILFSKNPIHSILYLIIVFIIATVLIIYLGGEYIAILFLVVYIGALIVLFLFVVMMLNIKTIELNERLISYVPISLMLGVLLLGLMYNYLNPSINVFQSSDITSFKNIMKQQHFEEEKVLELIKIYKESLIELAQSEHTVDIATSLYSNFVYIFILCGVVLLIALIGSIILTLIEKSRNKKQDFYDQTNRGIKKGLRNRF